MAVTSVPQSSSSGTLPDRPRRHGWAFDYWLALVAGALLVFGLLVVFSTTFPWSLSSHGDTTSIFLQQVQWLALGLAVIIVLLRFDYTVLRHLSVPVMIATIIALIAVLVVGQMVFGARRGLFNGSVQPGELAKLAIIIYLAHWLSTKGERLRSVKLGLVPYAIVVGFVAGLIFGQPDLSTALLIVCTAGTMFFVAGADLRQLGIGLLVAAAVFALVVPRLPYAQERIDEWQQALADPLKADWHELQVMIALGAGGPTGVGLGEGNLKWGLLPTPHTDSVFAVIGEELGLLGTLAVLGLFACLVVRGFHVARNARDEFGFILAIGVTCSLAYEALINMTVMTGIFPFTGVPLPFMSYGGSSLVVTMTSVGILLSISRGSYRSPKTKVRKTRANYDGGGWNGGARLPRARGR